MDASLCPVTFNILAPLAIETLLPSSDYRSMERRASRTATLDGGSVFYDAGYSVSDRDVTLRLPNTQNMGLKAKLRNFIMYHSECTLSIPEGIFLCIIKDYKTVGDDVTVHLFLKSEA